MEYKKETLITGSLDKVWAFFEYPFRGGVDKIKISYTLASHESFL
ncbi:MAG: hypothetical protein S4CHLAM2_11970 [Chlamydiales bacterium]|nr:hypothetical protein [Chlamydiales bacterium]